MSPKEIQFLKRNFIDKAIIMSIRKGEVVLRDDKLFSYIIFPRYGSYVCDCCLKIGETLFSCAKCHAVYYCDRECQIEAWRSHHSQECKLLFDGWNSGILGQVERGN